MASGTDTVRSKGRKKKKNASSSENDSEEEEEDDEDEEDEETDSFEEESSYVYKSGTDKVSRTTSDNNLLGVRKNTSLR